ncbi:MAG: hypothetical protein IKV62_09710 [Bacteroidales bacterium]|nr:hypothetical protein [Bacteroidales bacterium]
MKQIRNEWELERLFQESGPFFHIHTKPLETDVIFMNDEERAVAMVYIAIAAMLAGVDVLAYALMSNHFHFILRGQECRCKDFYARFAKMLGLYFSRHGRIGVLDAIEKPVPTPITTLKQLRDEIAYVIRNPFVVRKDVNPFAYTWCSGFLYFNPLLSMLPQRPASALTLREKRALTHSRNLSLPMGLTLVNGMVFPGSFVNYRLVESMFTDCRQYMFWVFKNVEALVETALRLGEKPSLPDDDILSISLQICKKEFGVKGPSYLTETQKYALAKKLKYDYYASNGQIARFTGLLPKAVDALFPLAAKPSSSK